MTWEPCDCGKRGWLTIYTARKACSNMGNRLRVYKCDSSEYFHVTDADKGEGRKQATRQHRAKRRQESRTKRRKWKQTEGL